MENITAWGAIILWIICATVVWVIYHKIFQVYYFNLGKGCATEIFICLFIGGILAGLIVWILPYALTIIGIVVAIVIVIVVIGKLRKNSVAKRAPTPSDETQYNSAETQGIMHPMSPDQVVCTHCGALYSKEDEMIFCSKCGNQFNTPDMQENESTTENPTFLVCDKCSAANFLDSVFCTRCGNQIYGG